MDKDIEIKFLLKLQGNYYTMIEVCDNAIKQGTDKAWWEEKKQQCQVAITDIRIQILSIKLAPGQSFEKSVPASFNNSRQEAISNFINL